MAVTFYDGYTRDKTWNTYVKTKNAAPASTPQSDSKPAAALVTGTCFNCGSKDHMLPDCPKPTDNKRITANKQKYLDAKKKAKADQTGSSAPPSLPHGTNKTQPSQRTLPTNNGNGNNGTPSERLSKWDPPREGGSQNRFIWTRTHGNQPYQFNPQTCRWDMMVPIPASSQGANTGTGGTASTSSANSSNTQAKSPSANTARAGDNTAELRAKLAELQRQMEAINEQL
jgi:hypothetical protein